MDDEGLVDMLISMAVGTNVAEDQELGADEGCLFGDGVGGSGRLEEIERLALRDVRRDNARSEAAELLASSEHFKDLPCGSV